MKKLNITPEEEKINVDEQVKKLKKALKKLTDEGYIEILNTDNSILPEIIDRAINSVKPFTEKKQEFRDCIIWLTYSNYVETNKMNHYFFITKNTSDFFNKSKNEIHEDLLKDTKRLKGYKDLDEFINNESKLIRNSSKLSINKNLKIKISELYDNKIFKDITKMCNDYIHDSSNDLMNKGYIPVGTDIFMSKVEIKEVHITSAINYGEDKINILGHIIVYVPVCILDDFKDEVKYDVIKGKVKFYCEKHVCKSNDKKKLLYSIDNKLFEFQCNGIEVLN